MDEYPTSTGVPQLDGPAEPDERLGSRDVVNSLTGFDELAIERRFGRSIEDLAENTGTTFLRALLYIVEKRRDGNTEPEAWDAAQRTTFGDLQARFKPDEQDPDPDLPGSPAGEGSGQLEDRPMP